MVALLKDISLTEPVRRAPARTGADHLYSTAALTNSAGGVVERYGYDAYGKRVTLNADGSAKTGNAATVVGFTGRTLDTETGLWYFRARMFDSSLLQFFSRDLWRKYMGSFDVNAKMMLMIPQAKDGYHDGLNLFRSYFSPNFTDNTGLFSDAECCSEATRRGLAKTDLGGVICCDGRKVACVWGTGSDATNDTAKRIFGSCIKRHEEAHFPDIPDCGLCEFSKSAQTPVIAVPSVSRPPIKWRHNLDDSECTAYKETVICLQSKIADCGNDVECRNQVQGEINRSTGRRDTHCAAVGR